ncbi:MAG: molybdopterin-dependent oxidoreductase, partial [Hyphomonas sp.]|nr:molybdopterin-dependent oxidoreductase [Hyphomonas sp.]
YEGGGAFHSNSDIFQLNKAELMGTAMVDPEIRMLDQSQIGRVLTGDAEALRHRGPVDALIIQNTNPVNVAPEQRLVMQGFLRNDLFVAVHEQFMTETAELADIVLPATMFVEHDDIYRGGGQSHILLGPKLVDAPPMVRTNLFVIDELAKRLGVADRPGFGKTEREHIEHMLAVSGKPDFDTLAEDKWLDCQPAFDDAHYLNGFAHPDGKFRFKPARAGEAAPDLPRSGRSDRSGRCRTSLPAGDIAGAQLPQLHLRRNQDLARQGRPSGGYGQPRRCLKPRKPGVLVAEGLWPNKSHLDGEGINVLTGADPAAPHGGAAFHDNKVWMRKA